MVGWCRQSGFVYKDVNSFFFLLRTGFSVGSRRLLIVNGTFVVAASSDKPLMDVWYLQHRSTERRTIVTPGVVKALAASQDGVFLAAAIDEQVRRSGNITGNGVLIG